MVMDREAFSYICSEALKSCASYPKADLLLSSSKRRLVLLWTVDAWVGNSYKPVCNNYRHETALAIRDIDVQDLHAGR